MLEAIAGMGIPALFASRTFLPAFAMALMLRFGPDLGLDGTGLLAAIGTPDAPTWFTSNAFLTVLGLLALCELIAHRSTDAREFLALVDQYGKPVLAVVTLFGVASISDANFVEKNLVYHEASLFIDMFAVSVAAGTYILAAARNSLMLGFLKADEDDSSGIFGIFSWGEELYSFFGPIFLLLFPIVMLVLLGGVAGAILFLKRRGERKEEQSKVPCESCQTPIYRAAMRCQNCDASNASITRLNWLGASTDELAKSLEAHPVLLAEKKRCPSCATRFQQRQPRQECDACGHLLFDDPQFLEAYDRQIMQRMPTVMVVCALLSLIPVFGLIPGVIYYRLALIAPYRRYIPRGQAFLLRWAVRIGCLLLISTQWLPLFGMLTVPAMAGLNLYVYRGMFLKLAGHQEAKSPLAGQSVSTSS